MKQGLSSISASLPDPRVQAVGKSESNKLPNSHISLKQWNLLVAVVHSASYASAAEELNLSQPAISYTLAKIEEHVGFSILQIEGRRARITEAGKQLVIQVKPLLQRAIEVEEFAAKLKKQWRPRIRIVVDSQFPLEKLLPALRTYSDDEPGTKVTLLELPQADVHRVMQERNAELAVTRELHEGLQGNLLAETQRVLVAQPAHPLFALNRPVTDADLQSETRVVVDSSPDAMTDASASRNLWVVRSVDTAEKMLSGGMGFGWLTHYQAESALAAGRLAILPMADDMNATLHFYLAHHASAIPSIEVKRLASMLQKTVASKAQPKSESESDSTSESISEFQRAT